MVADEKYFDYDAAFAEEAEARRPLTRRLFGQVWELPGVPNAAVVIRLARLFADGRSEEDLTDGETLMLAADLIPGDILDQWLAKGLDVSQLAMILQDLMVAYGDFLGATEEGEPSSPEASTPATGDSTSSSAIGPSSKPTSDASTRSIFQVG